MSFPLVSLIRFRNMDDVGGRSPSPPPLKGNPDDVGDLPPSAEDVLVVDAKPSTLASPSNDKDTGINSKVCLACTCILHMKSTHTQCHLAVQAEPARIYDILSQENRNL